MGWTLGIALWGGFTAGVVAVFGAFPIVGLLATLASLAVFYRLCAGYFDACFNGARGGRLEPAATAASGDFSMMGYALGGGAVLVYLIGYVIAIHLVILGAFGMDPTNPTYTDNAVLLGVRTLLFVPAPVAFALRAASQSSIALFALPHQLRVMAAAGGAYVVPVLVGNFALAVPFTLLMVSADAGLVPLLLELLLSSAISAYAFGAMGAAMGWIANRNKDVDGLLG
jgi:hypothetical protein